MVFSAAAFPALRALHGDKAVWKLLDDGPERFRRVAAGRALPRDVDTWEDYEAALRAPPFRPGARRRLSSTGTSADTFTVRAAPAADQHGLAEEILHEARLKAETIRKEADLRSKEEALRRREAIEAEAEEGRKALREQEKRLEKRADLLDQKLELINRKEREFETVQRHLAEQQEELDRARPGGPAGPGRAARARCTGSPSSAPTRPASCCSAASRTTCGTRSAA